MKLVYDFYDQENQAKNRDYHEMAPTKHYKMGYQKFINFQKFYVFQTPDS